MTRADFQRRFPTADAALAHLEQVRWGKIPTCPYCFCDTLSRRKENGRAARWQCSNCTKSASATVGTVFHNSHVDLRHWFFVIATMLHARGRVINVAQLARDLGIRRATVADMIERLSVRLVTERNFFTALVRQRS